MKGEVWIAVRTQAGWVSGKGIVERDRVRTYHIPPVPKFVLNIINLNFYKYI